MRHRKRRSKLSMKTARRNATVRSMVASLFKYQRIQTTLARAKVVRRLAEKMVTIAKQDTVFARRRAYSVLADRDMVAKLFKEIVPLFVNRHSGYTRIIPMGFRRGDGATLAILELTDRKIVEKLPKKKAKAKPEAAKPDAAQDEHKKPKEEHKKEEPKIKTIPRAKPTLQEEKMAEKAKSEDKKAADKRGFMKNIRGFFRKRGDR